jgi:diguanylate cyclase (GGDEF)-like protein
MTDSIDGSRIRAWRSRAAALTARTTASTRVWLLTGTLAIAMLALGLVLPARPPVSLPFAVPWWLVAVLFFIVEARVVHLHIGRSAHSFSMSELPLVPGLFLLAPVELVVARVVGSGLALLTVRRQRSAKLAFNVVQFGVATTVALLVMGLAGGLDHGFGPLLWLGVYAAMLTENLVGVLCVSTAISLAEGTPQYRRIPEMLRIGIIVSMTNTSLALMALTVLWANPLAAVLFVAPFAAAALGYRAYISERQQHENLELLYESTRILQRSPQMDTALVALLTHARKMFRADVAEIALLPRRAGDDVLRTRVGPGGAVDLMRPIGPAFADAAMSRAVTERRAFLLEDATDELGEPAGRARARGGQSLVAPLIGESALVGAFVVSHRLNDISPFDREDLRLFEALANHTAVALENGQLEQSLERLSQLKDELHHQASHDALTGLVNRTLFGQIVAQRLEAPREDGQLPVVLFIDLDDFKVVNDSLGHAAGDALLIAVGDRLRSTLRSDDIAARIGGDEFAVLLWDEPNLRVAVRVADRLTAAMTPSFLLDGHEVVVRASIGMAAGRPGVVTAGDVLRDADVAMYSAKAAGKGRVVVFEPAMHQALMVRAQLLADLEQAVARRQFVLQYQPIIELATGRMTGVEALVRWEHPERGRIEPASFIPIAEESETIILIGRWVLAEACRQARAWSRLAAGRPFTVSVNISSRELAQPGFIDDVLATIRNAGVDPTTMVLEMTETAMLNDSEDTRAKLLELREAGVGISVDDFGTGYSSLSYLQRFPVTTLKIARDFIDIAGSNPDDWELASAIIALGSALRLAVVAEGVEQPAQLGRLQALGCRYAQGFYFARPLDPASIGSILAHGGALGHPADPGAAAGDASSPSIAAA